MRTLKRLFQYHTVIVLTYAGYLFLWVIVGRTSMLQDTLENPEKQYVGHALIFQYYFTLIISFLYALISFAQGLYTSNRIYYRLSLLILLPAMLMTIWGYW